MTTRIKFNNVEFFAAPSGQRLRVLLGESFFVALDGAPEGGTVRWATVNDEALDVTEFNALSIDVVAAKVGAAEIQVQVDRDVQYYITVDVYSNEAASLNPVAGAPELK